MGRLYLRHGRVDGGDRLAQARGMKAEGMQVTPARAALLVVDIQERLAAAMPAEAMAACEKNTLILIELARRLGLPVVASEQYPRGLGPTVPALAAALARAEGGLDVHRLEKLEFATVEAPGFAALSERLGRQQWIVVGMESHVCVWQTVRGLLGRGAEVQVPADAVCSRTADNRATGLRLMERAGAVVTSTEAVVFDALGRAGTDEFKALSRLIK